MSSKQRFEPVVDALTGVVGRMIASTRRRRTERQLASFSTRLVKDVGFERDWDGSVYRPGDLH